ncbi:MAG: 2-deoxyribose-5-phosphate aldolase [Acidimicrobiales bacterium]
MASLSRTELAQYLDHTILSVGASDTDVACVCTGSAGAGVFAICVSPSKVTVARSALAGIDADVPIAAVVGFPSGAHRSDIKAVEAAAAVADGASEIDMVINLGLVANGDWGGVEADMSGRPGCSRSPRRPESHHRISIAFGRRDRGELRAGRTSRRRLRQDIDGISPAGGATIAAVHLMAATVGGRLGVKASGGIRTTEAALAMIEAGATRIGTSSSEAILAGP